ncbi:MAG: DUF4838 domain-containing protein [Armatimonadota bacterium]|nr:DUF4838 domain-containing protein [bacterium]MDW8321598.1 DUF4838 domain-containing protein [Armatimonadota bacterium]
MVLLCFLGVLLTTPPASAVSRITLVRNGSPQAVIVAPANAQGNLAAAINDLQVYLQKMSGARLSIVTESPAGHAAIVLRVGAHGLSDVGYRLRTEGNRLIIEGATEAGVVNGVYGLLEDHLGVRWYIPGELGEYVPRRKTVTLPALNETREPAIPSVTGFGGYRADPPSGVEWIRRNRLAGFQPYMHHHNWESIIPTAEAERHPEWFALIDGRRQIQLCTTHPEVIRIAVQRVLDYFDKNPQAKTFSLSPNDSEKFCQCERCRALDRELGIDPFVPGGQFTDRLLVFFNQIAEEVAKRYPDKILCFYAYVTHTDPPQRVKPHPNLMPVICRTPWEFCHAHPITADCAPCRRFRQVVLRWREMCRHVGIYDYYGHWRWFGQWPLVHTLKVEIPFYAKAGIEHLHSETHGNWWTQPLNFLAAVKLVWNPRTDTDRLIRDFCHHLFAESAEPVYRYFTLYEDLMANMPLEAKNHEDWFVYPPAEAVEKGQNLLNEAFRRAQSEVVKERVRRLQIGHRVYTMQWRAATARRAGNLMRAYEAEVQFARMVQHLQNSDQQDIIEMWLAKRETLRRSGEAQAYVELLANAGYATPEEREQAWRDAQTEGIKFARKMGCITEWQVTGPFPCRQGELDKTDVPVDSINLSQRFSTPLGEVGWRLAEVNHPFGLFDMGKLFPADPWLSAYAACWVKLPGPPAISLRVGSNDGAAVWLDGKLILLSDVPRGFLPDQDRVLVVGDGERWRLLVVKVVNHGGAWNVAVRFTDLVGRPLQVPMRATPPE